VSDFAPAPDEDSPNEVEAPKTRSPIERAIVWTLIAGLCGLLGFEYFALDGYNSTLKALDKIREDPEVLVPLSEVRQSMISGSPSETKIKKFGTEKLELKWMSFFKDYQIHLTLASDEKDPNVLGYVTPNAPEETPQLLDVPEDGTDTSGGMEMSMPPDMDGGGGEDGGPPGGGPERGAQRGGRRRASGLLAELQQEWVQAELGMSDEQTEKLPEVTRSAISGIEFSSFQSMTNEERQAARQEIGEKLEAGLKELLDEQQFNRARQLMLHRMGPAAFARADVAAELELDDSQKKQVEELAPQLRPQRRGPPEDGEIARNLLLEMLTEEQVGKWAAMKGHPPGNRPKDGSQARRQRPNSD
jgi:hypothetical protein